MRPETEASRVMVIPLMIVDDHQLIRKGLRMVFETTEVDVIAEATDGQEAWQALQSQAIEVAIVDLHMPGMDGFLFLKRVQDNGAPVAILVHSVHGGPATIRQCRELGARGFLTKGVDQERLVDAVRTVSAGGEWWPP